MYNIDRRQKIMLLNEYDDVMTVEQFMDYLAVGKTTAYRLLKKGEIKAFKIGRVYKIPKKSVDEYIEEKRHNK